MQPIEVPGDWRDRLDGLLDRRPHGVAIGVVVVSLLFLFVATRNRATAHIAPPASAPSVVPSAVSATSFVHVAGAVVAPGLYELPEGSRVADAIEVAGGARRNADLDALNLAQVLTDGMKVDVITKGSNAASIDASTETDALVSINSADATTLETIPGVGPVTAAAIIEYRDRLGGFGAIDDLIEVTGIGPATLEALRPYVSL